MTLSHLILLTTQEVRHGRYNYPTLWMRKLRLGEVKLDQAHSVIRV